MRRWPAWLLMASLLAGGLLWWLRPPAPVAPQESAAPTPAAWLLADGSVAGLAAEPLPGPATADTPAADLDGSCGWAAWTAQVGPGAWPAPAERKRVARSLAQQLSQHLQTRGESRAEAVGWWLDATPVQLGDEGWSGCSGADCDKALRKTLRQMERHADSREAARQTLIERALASSDPAVVALGLQACQQRADDHACAPALAVLWSELEPDNAAAWLALARLASQRADRAAEAQAMHNASVAVRYRPVAHWLMGDLFEGLSPQWQGGPRLALQGLLATSVAGIATSLGAALSYCREPGALGASRRATCTALAELLLGQARELTDLMFALLLARQVGLPESRLAPLQADIDTLREPLAELEARALGAPASPAACRAVHMLSAHWLRRATQGELAALRTLARQAR